MQTLERLYDCAGEYLTGQDRDWDGFCDAFERIFGAKIAAYISGFNKYGLEQNRLQIIGSTDMDFWTEYARNKHYLKHILLEPDAQSMEPKRLSDFGPEGGVDSLGELGAILADQDIYHIILIHADINPQTFFGLFLWRGRQDENFTDLEKQRLALFMRHMVALLGNVEKALAGPTAAFQKFGARYNLTPTETNILSALVQGHSLRQISEKTGRGYGTVRWHVQNMLEKCHVNTQQQLLSEFYLLVDG